MSAIWAKQTKRWRGSVWGAVGMAVLGLSTAARAQSSPLDPLSSAEIDTVTSVLKKAGYASGDTRYPWMKLNEPNKDAVLNGSRGIRREAYVVVKNGSRSFEGVIDLDSRKVLSYQALGATVQPPVLGEEFGAASAIAVADLGFQQHLRARGIFDFSTVICLPLSAGNYDVPSEKGKRLLRSTCLNAAGVQNFWARPIENLTAVIDLNAGKVVEIVDSGVVPMSTADGNFFPPVERPAPKPLIVSQPSGSDVSINGQEISWDKWKFHFRVEQRDGLILSRVRYNDKGRERSVMYRANLSETFVPYADPSSNWYFRTYMDEGEYGFGKSTQPLVPLKDCPANAIFRDVVIPADDGSVLTIPKGLCIFEQTPYLALHHTDIFTGTETARSGRTLTVRYATIVGNYDYIFDWTFEQDGTFGMRAGATGVVETKGVRAQNVQEGDRNGDTLYGSLVDKGLVGSNHQHIFSVRLDLDVDGKNNEFVTLTPRVVRAPSDSKRKSAWVVDERIFNREQEARFEEAGGSQWTVINSYARNRLGYPTGYTLEVENDNHLLMSQDDPASRRAGYARYNLWVTPYRINEIYASGDFPNQSEGGEGLPQWTAQNRSIRNEDLVLWVNLGLTHITRAEDWPLMSTEWFGNFHLRPFMFFDRNPGTEISDAP